MESASKRDRSRRAELQRLLGDRGVVLPRVAHGTIATPAQGWYARMNDGELRFFGDHASLAAVKISVMIGDENMIAL